MRVVQIAKKVQKCKHHLNLHGNQDPRIPDMKSPALRINQNWFKYWRKASWAYPQISAKYLL